MGLDMYLEAQRSQHEFAGWERDATGSMIGPLKRVELTGIPDVIKTAGISPSAKSFIESYEIGYWRKANHIHNWFVDNCADGVDECQKIYVSREQLEKLRRLCIEVLANRDNPKKASELLPCAEGFFFGSSDYDEYYYDNVEDTVRILDAAIEIIDSKPEEDWSEWHIIYQASW